MLRINAKQCIHQRGDESYPVASGFRTQSLNHDNPMSASHSNAYIGTADNKSACRD